MMRKLNLLTQFESMDQLTNFFYYYIRTIKEEIEKEKKLQESILKESKLNNFDSKSGGSKAGINRK